MNETNLASILEQLGLSKDQANVYISLAKHGKLTILDLSRKTDIKRTTVYRLVEKMKKDGLVEEIIDEKRILVQAASPEKLEQLLKQKKENITKIEKVLPEVQKYLSQQVNDRQPDTKVLFYRGKSGIQQMAWNIINTKPREVVGYTQTDFTKAVGKKFADSLYNEMHFLKIRMRDLISDRYVESVGGISALLPINKLDNFVSRYLPAETLDIDHTMDAYNNIVSIYNWHGGEIFGVEIYNEKVAKMQKQIFEILWKMAIPEEKILEKLTKSSD